MLDGNAPRIAWFTPLRPVESGISLYNEELLPVLAAAWQLDVYVDGYRPTHLAQTATLRVRPAREFPWAHRRRPYDAIVYQMGNNPAHAYMYDLALRYPGVVVLHDTLLHHLVLAMMLRRNKARAYRALMERRYGRPGWEAATRVLKGQIPAALFAFPLSEDIITGSRVVVVHSDHSRREVAERHPDAKVLRVPMGIRTPQEIPQSLARRILGLPDGLFVLGSVTHVNPYKRLDVVLRAVRRLRQDVPARLLVAGSVSHLVPLDHLVSLLGLEGTVETFGFVDDLMARLIVAASDACVNLRYPTAGETSASLLRMMGVGRPVLVSDAGSFSELPDDAVVKVPVDALEEETLLELLRALARRPGLAAEIGRRARAFVEREHSLAAMAAGYHAAIEAAIGAPIPRPAAVEAVEALGLPPVEAVDERDPLVEGVAAALVELGLGGDRRLMRVVAEAAAEIGLAVGKMGGTRTVS